MKWIKKGLIYKPDGTLYWNKKYGILPTPLHLPEEKKIRVFYSSTDENNFGRVSYIDVNENNPAEILYKHSSPILDMGEKGTFDDCGVNPSGIVLTKENKYLLYYVGYQRTFQTPYMLFVGAAYLSNDFSKATRVSNAPIIDRSAEFYLSHAAPFVIREGNLYKMWLWLGKNWTSINGKPYISAAIGYAESTDGINWKVISSDCITPDPEKEFSVGRPWVIFEDSIYKMYYSVRYIDKLYRLGYAESADGIKWKRKDNEAGIDVSESGWDSEMICYPAVINVKDKKYLFYNGNNNGVTGFGYAELA